jgi:hypothetical protein
MLIKQFCEVSPKDPHEVSMESDNWLQWSRFLKQKLTDVLTDRHTERGRTQCDHNSSPC